MANTTRPIVRRPMDALNRSVNSNVTVLLKSGEEYTGTLVKCDELMNLFLTDVTVNDRNGSVRMSLKKVFIRGNNILMIYLQG